MTVKKLIQAEIDNIPEEKLDEFYQLIKEFIDKTHSDKKGILSKLKEIKIQASENFSVNFDSYHDLDYLAGTWGEEDETEFLANTKQFNEVDNNLWK
jgi:hypothetical protein